MQRESCRPSPVTPHEEPKASVAQGSEGELLKGNQLLTFAGGHHLNNFSSPFIAFSLIKKHSYIAYHSLFSLVMLFGSNTSIAGTWQKGT